MTLSLAAVFIPILFMAGILGRLFREFAVTICAAILISGMVSISLTPMLCSRFLREHKPRSTASSIAPWKRVFDGMLRLYGVTPALGAAPPAGDAGAVRRRAGGHRLSLCRSSPRASFPIPTTTISRQHRSGAGHLVLPDGQVPADGLGRSWCRTRTSRRSTRAPAAWAASAASGNTGRMMVNLKPRRQREAPRVADIVNRLRPKVSSIPGAARVHVRFRRPSASAAACQKSGYDFTLYGPDTAAALRRGAEVGAGRWRACPASGCHRATCRSRTRASTSCSTATAPPPCGLNWIAGPSALYDAFGPQLASTIYAPTNQYRVLLEMLPQYPDAYRRAEQIYLKSRYRQPGAAERGGER